VTKELGCGAGGVHTPSVRHFAGDRRSTANWQSPSNPPHPRTIRAELIGHRVCAGGGFTVRAATPSVPRPALPPHAGRADR
jgi:hypothetical protein